MDKSRSALGAVLAILIAFAPGLHARAQGVELAKPRLEIPIPSVTFSGATLNYIGEYIAGVYKYLLGIAGALAATVMIIGGFQYLTAGGDKSRVDAGKRRIGDALVGLILAFGSYALLYAINPRLVTFEALQMTAVRTDPLVSTFQTQMGTTQSNTALAETAPPPQPGDITYEFTACPFTYVASHKEENARKKEFIANAPKYLTKTDMGERIVQAAQLADVCNPVLGSCGTTVGTIIALAFKGNPNYEKMSMKSSSKNADCLDPNLAAGKGGDGPFNCNGFRLGESFSVGAELRKEQFGRRCDIDQIKENRAKREELITAGKLKPGEFLSSSGVKCNETQCTSNGIAIPRTPCAKSASEARMEYVKLVQAAGIKGYPDSWADSLRPGDYVNIYNGNTDLTGGHAILFMGWAKDGKHAIVVQGGGGCAKNASGQTECRVARPGLVCLKSACGGLIMPITSIYSWR